MQPERVPPGPEIDPASGSITFRVDPDERWRPRRVWFHLRGFGADPEFALDGQSWVARIPRPPVARLEYLLDIVSTDGEQALVCDPANPERVPGVFGDKSVIELPGYEPPWWLSSEVDPAHAADTPFWQVVPLDSGGAAGQRRDLRRARWGHPSAEDGDHSADGLAQAGERAVRDTSSDVAAVGTLLAPVRSAPDEPLPLLLVHDGPEYDRFAALSRYLAVLGTREPALRCRLLLLRPVDRDRSYSASPGYARALTEGLLPQVRAEVAVAGPVVGMGASLGGLSLLHIAVTRPGSIDTVFSQSGSFFAADSDPMELNYRFFDRIADFVAGIDRDPGRLAGLTLSMTCGTGEENLTNNRRLHRRLVGAGVPVTLAENADGHNYVGWRDCLDPALADLLRRVWTGPGRSSPER